MNAPKRLETTFADYCYLATLLIQMHSSENPENRTAVILAFSLSHAHFLPTKSQHNRRTHRVPASALQLRKHIRFRVRVRVWVRRRSRSYACVCQRRRRRLDAWSPCCDDVAAHWWTQQQQQQQHRTADAVQSRTMALCGLSATYRKLFAWRRGGSFEIACTVLSGWRSVTDILVGYCGGANIIMGYKIEKQTNIFGEWCADFGQVLFNKLWVQNTNIIITIHCFCWICNRIFRLFKSNISAPHLKLFKPNNSFHVKRIFWFVERHFKTLKGILFTINVRCKENRKSIYIQINCNYVSDAETRERLNRTVIRIVAYL